MPITQNLGTVQAIFIDSAAPSNTAMLWYNTVDKQHYYFDTGSSTWKLLKSVEWTKTFSNAGARAASVPIFIGQIGIQLDDDSLWISNGLSAGNWVVFSAASVANIINITYSALSTLKTNSTLVKGTYYNITDRNIILFATDINNLSLEGHYKAYNADYQHVGSYTGVAAATGITPSGTNQGIWSTTVLHTVGKLVIWGGFNWINNNGNLGSITDDNTLSADWTKLNVAITPTTQGYIFEIDSILYDFNNDVLVQRSDKRGNLINSNDPTAFDLFQWGKNGVTNNTVSFSDSYINILNGIGAINDNVVLNGSFIEAVRNKGNIQYNHLDTGSTINAENFRGQIQLNKLSDSSIIASTQLVTGNIAGNNLSGNSVLAAVLNGGTIQFNIICNSSNITATSNLGSIEGNSLLNESNIIATNQAVTGSIDKNNLSNVSVINGLNNAGDTSNNTLSNDSEIDASSQSASGICTDNNLINGGLIDVSTNSGQVSVNGLSTQASIDASINTGGVVSNTLSSEGSIVATNNSLTIQDNFISEGGIINAINNTGVIIKNNILNSSILNASANSGTIQNNAFSRNANIDLSTNAVTVQNQEYTVNGNVTTLFGSATLDFGNTSTQTSADLTITVTGALLNDVVGLAVPNASINANSSYMAWVSSANTITVRFNNYSSGSINPASGLFKVQIQRR